MRAAILSTSLVLGASSALAQVPTTDGALTLSEGVSSEGTERTDAVEKGANVKRTGSLCSVWRGGRGPQSSLDRNQHVTDLIRRIAREEGVAEHVALAISYQESRFNPCARSHVGAYGLFQLMPGTAKDLGVNPFDPEQNIRGGLRYFKTQLRKFGSIELALAAYNAGPGNVRKYGGIPPFKETEGYVANITGKWIPKFGGIASSSDPIARSRFEASSTPAMQAGGLAAANADSFAEVQEFFDGKASEAAKTGTLLDTVDANADARIANIEMWNRAIVTASTVLQLVNALNTTRHMGTSGSAELSTTASSDEVPYNPFDPDPSGRPDDPTVIVVGAPDGVCEEIEIERAVDPDCVDPPTDDGRPVAVGTALDALVASTLAPPIRGGETIATPLRDRADGSRPTVN